MSNEYYGAPTTPTSDYLAHYGVKGMKWGVRRARGNDRAMARQYAKAQRKLAKLERRAVSGKKYAKRAALLGAGAGIAGASAIPGLGNYVSKIPGGIGKTAGKYASKATGGNAYAQKMADDFARGKASSVYDNISKWGNDNSIANAAATKYGSAAGKYAGHVTGGNAYAQKMANDMARGNAKKAVGGITNKQIARVGAAAVGAGLLGAAGYNAYRAATTKRAARKAAEFRREMNKQFAGYNSNGGRKRRRR